MSSPMVMNKSLIFSLRIVILVITICLALALRGFAQYSNVTGVVFLFVGEISLLLMGFTVREVAAAVESVWRATASGKPRERSTCFWEAGARNALGLGVLGTLAGFAIQISSEAGSPDLFLGSLADTVLATVYGLVLAAVFSITGLRVRRQREPHTDVSPTVGVQPGGTPVSGGWESWIGSALFAALVLWVVLSPSAGGRFSASDWLMSWPAWLSVMGGALILGFLLGDPADGEALVLGFAYAGGISALVGLVRALHGFAETSIALVSAGSSWMISSCFAALVGMLAAAAARQDRAGRSEGNLSRLAWYGLPAVSLIFLALVILMVMTPITIRIR